MTKEELGKIHGEVLTTSEAVEKYEFVAFCAPFVKVRRKTDDQTGTLEFQHNPHFTLNLSLTFKKNRCSFENRQPSREK